MFHTDMDFDVAPISLVVKDEDSSPSQADSSSWKPCSGEKVSFKPERVGVRFSIWLGAQLPFVFTLSHYGEGIYQPYTAQMHLVTKVQLEGVEDDLGHGQVYVKIYYTATNSKETR